MLARKGWVSTTQWHSLLRAEHELTELHPDDRAKDVWAPGCVEVNDERLLPVAQFHLQLLGRHLLGLQQGQCVA